MLLQHQATIIFPQEKRIQKTVTAQADKDYVVTYDSSGIANLQMSGGDPYIRAFMRAITIGEGTSKSVTIPKLDYPDQKVSCDPYHIVVTYKCFEGDKHPFLNGRRAIYIPSYDVHSTASGRYQFIRGTWKSWTESQGADINDFSPANQDQVVYNLLNERYDLSKHFKNIDLNNNEQLKGALRKALDTPGKNIGAPTTQWASLPGSKYGQRTETFRDFFEIYKSLLQQELKISSDLEQDAMEYMQNPSI
jgi:muramidase (phage lysozyme)